jgi:hypothetical protein
MKLFNTILGPVEHQRHPLLCRQISIALLTFGLLLNLINYLSNRSIWYDELQLILNLMGKSYGKLWLGLANNQAAPPLFLWIEKFSFQLGGNHEYVWRLPPFSAGIISIILFYRLAHATTQGITTPIAIALFSTSESIIYFSAETKPYIVDLAIGLALMLILYPLHARSFNYRQSVFLGLLGSIFILLSFPTVFMLAGNELVSWLKTPKRLLGRILKNRVLAYLAWLTSFSLLYFVSISQTLDNESLVTSWAARYPRSMFDFVWLFDAIGRFFYQPLGFSGYADGLAIFAFLCGCIAIYRRDRWLLIWLNAPFLVTLTASFCHQYPFRGRLVLFLAPYSLLVIAEGISFLLLSLKKPSNPGLTYQSLVGLIGLFLLLMLTVPTLSQSTQRLFKPEIFAFDHLRPIIREIQSDWEQGDQLFVFPSAQLIFRYYSERYSFQPKEVIFGQNSVPEFKQFSAETALPYQQEISQLKGRGRVWFLFMSKSPVSEGKLVANINRSVITQGMLLSDLNRLGRQLKLVRESNALGALYDTNAQSD